MALERRMILGDSLEATATLPESSVDLIVADPPYHRVKDEAWDRQWKTDADYLAWIGHCCAAWRRVLKSNGSLYVFASPQMAVRVECKIGETFNVLNRITWRKDDGWHKKAELITLRQFFPASEAIVFAEQCGSDQSFGRAIIAENADYTTSCERAKRMIFGEYLKAEFDRAGVGYKEIAEGIGAYGKVNHGGSVSNWVLGLNCPTAEQYTKLRDWLNNRDCQSDYLRREYDYLRREYEDLRRPFTVTVSVPFTDVWDFATVQARPGKHPCAKPIPLLSHIVNASSRPDSLVLDPFAGGGTLGEVCRELGRAYIGIERDPDWYAVACRRVQAERLMPEDETTTAAPKWGNMPLFSETIESTTGVSNA